MSQIRYINNKTGQDKAERSGSIDKPFKTIRYALTRCDDGDELFISDISMLDNSSHHEIGTIVIDNRNDLILRFGGSDFGSKPSNMKWYMDERPEQEDYDQDSTDVQWESLPEHLGSYALQIVNSKNIKVVGVTFACANQYQSGCIDISCSEDIEIYSCTTKDFQINSQRESLFDVFQSEVTFTGMILKDVTNDTEVSEGDTYYKFFDLRGPSNVTFYSCQAAGYTSDNIPFIAVQADQDVRKLNINGILVHNCESNTIDGSTGIIIDRNDGSGTDFDILNGQFSHIRTGIVINNMPPAKKQSVARIAQCTFYHCATAIKSKDSDFIVTNVDIYGTGDPEDTSYEIPAPEGQSPSTVDTYGIIAYDKSSIEVTNTNVTYCNVCFASFDNSLIDVTRTIFCDNAYFKEEENDGEVRADDYVRATDPCYEEVDKYPYGFFKLKNNSPCINAGRNVGLAYTGAAPNIGSSDQDRYITSSDLLSIAAKQVRNAETYKMTDMDVEGMMVAGLKALDPDAAADREGSAIRDLFIKPATELSTAFITELEGMRNGMSFLNVDSMTEDEADALAANLIVSRRSGAKATGVVRMFFDRPIDFDLPAETMFSTSSGLHFYSISRTTFTLEEMQNRFDGNLYYVDVIVEGEETGSAYNIGPGEISICNDISSTQLVLVTNNSYFSGGETRETNRELYERVKMAITTRCLNTTKGVKFQFLEAFSFLRRITVIGKGDPEMIRDDLRTLVEETHADLPEIYDTEEIIATHIGGKTDVYAQVYEPVEDYVDVEVIPASAKLEDLGLVDKPILRITSLEILNMDGMDPTGVLIPDNNWRVISHDARTRFSTRESLSLEVDDDYVNNPVRIHYMWSYETAAMQKWAESDDNRVICEDILVKHHQPAFVNLSLAYNADEEVEDMETLVREYIMSIPEKKSLKVSDLIDFVYDQTAIHVLTPLLITATLHKNDGSIERYESYDEIVISRISCFIPDNIEIVYMGEDPNK